MREEKKLLKKFKQEFETPETPFEEWAAQRGVGADSIETAECPVYELADNVNGRSAGNNRRRTLLIFAPIIAFFVALTILLGCLLLHDVFLTPYGVTDSVVISVKLEEITERKDIYMFDVSAVYEMGSIRKHVLDKDRSLILTYSIDESLVPVENGEVTDGFYFSYRIKTYPRYEFVDRTHYRDLNKTVTIQNKKLNYKIVESSEPAAYAKFTVGKYDYFVAARGLEDVTVLNEENFLRLLHQVII